MRWRRRQPPTSRPRNGATEGVTLNTTLPIPHDEMWRPQDRYNSAVDSVCDRRMRLRSKVPAEWSFRRIAGGGRGCQLASVAIQPPRVRNWLSDAPSPDAAPSGVAQMRRIVTISLCSTIARGYALPSCLSAGEAEFGRMTSQSRPLLLTAEPRGGIIKKYATPLRDHPSSDRHARQD